jgi:hypothetical protein
VQKLWDGSTIKPLNAELNLICHLLALLGVHPILHISRIRVKLEMFLLKLKNKEPEIHPV